MAIKQLIGSAFALANSLHPDVRQAWVKASLRVGALLPDSLLDVSVQRFGELDILLRALEDESTRPGEADGEVEIWATTQLVFLSEIWVGGLYETFRALKARKLVADKTFDGIARDLKLIRITLEKYEIADDNKLDTPLAMQRQPDNAAAADIYYYSKLDPRRAHIMPSGKSDRGSVMWGVTDIRVKEARWLERRALSDRIITLWML